MACRNGNVFPYKTNRGLARSWNDGLHLATEADCDAVLLLNDDLFFYPGGYQEFRQTVEVVRTLSNNVSHVTVIGLETGTSHHAGQIIPQNFACCAIMRETIARVGYFDETFSPAYYEDIDYARRAALTGMTLHVDQRVLVEHERSSTYRSMSERDRQLSLADVERNRLYFVTKWGCHDNPDYVRPFDDEKYGLDISFSTRSRPYNLALFSSFAEARDLHGQSRVQPHLHS